MIAYVDLVGDFFDREVAAGKRRRVEALRPTRYEAGKAQRTLDASAIRGRFENDGCRCELRRADADVVDTHVVGVSVAAVPVVDGECVGILGLQDGCQSTRCGIDRDVCESVAQSSCSTVGAGVAVTQVDDLVDTQRARGCGQFPATHLGELGAGSGNLRRSQPCRTVCRGDEDDAMSLRHGPSEGAAGEQSFVVRVGVEGHQRVAHDVTTESSGSAGHASKSDVPPVSDAERR